MAAFVVLLRGVNIGPHRRISTSELRGAALDVGFSDVRSLLNSGNVVVTTGTSGATTPEDAARLLSDRLTETVGTEVRAIALTTDRLRTISAENPFAAAARTDPSQLQVHFPFGTVDNAGIARLDLRHRGREHIGVAAGVVYVHYVDGIGRSKITSEVLDRASGTTLTARNWNTVTRLLEMLKDLS